jgi:hypothetical protein
VAKFSITFLFVAGAAEIFRRFLKTMLGDAVGYLSENKAVT